MARAGRFGFESEIGGTAIAARRFANSSDTLLDTDLEPPF